MFLLIPIAFISGVLTVFSPCVLPILPIVLASGVDGRLMRIRGVIVGLVVSFTVITLSFSAIVRLLGIPADTIRWVAVFFLFVFGISLLFPVIWNTLQGAIERYWHISPIRTTNASFWGGFVTGVSLGVVWSPCVGPIVASVATLAALDSFSLVSILLVFSYAVGTGVPLYFIAKGGARASLGLAVFKRKNQMVRRLFGLVLIGTAFFIWFGIDRALQAWTLSTLPSSWTQIATNFESTFNVTDRLKSLQKEKTLIMKGKPGSVVVQNVNLQNDFTGAKVRPSDIEQGCFGGKDCIPSIDKPQFESANQATWLRSDDTVFAINYKGVVRAYPQRILNWHEIVNDMIAQDPIAITFCPLCGSALAFDRRVDGIITEFGVSGKLHNSDLVMYDRYEGNLWQQITGEAIVGPAARRNEVLTQIPIVTTTWGKWKKEHSNTEVLSRETGHSRDYDAYPYGTYEQDDELYFGVKNVNKRLQIKTVVYGVEVGGKAKAYPASAFDKNSVITDTISDATIRLEKTDAGAIKVTNLQTNETIVPIRLFWFAWAAFHPDTELYQ